MDRRTIIYSNEFDLCVEKLGGYRYVDRILAGVIDGLSKNPFGYEKFESDSVSFRYVRAKNPKESIELYVIFTIEPDRTVVLQHVEEIMPF